MDDIKAKQQLLEKIKEATNILVTVSDNPSVDALSSAIGLTLLLDKMDKHATAVFSGVVPPAIAFLEPEKILDDTTDSLRDFIIALDKEKADHLRYKVEGDAVKIFITPYKTALSSDDLVFSQGDYNVELVIALGVDDQDHLDKALEAHGQILHDATVATVTAGDQTSTLGGIDWHDDKASSLSEMLTGLSEALKTDKNKSLLDAPIATAFLTGIVAQTERFSNRNTTSKAMTVASQLMVAGADQQLIATQLEATYDEPAPAEEPEPEEEKPVEEEPVAEEDRDKIEPDGTLKIGKHKDREPQTEPKPAPKQEQPEPEPKPEPTPEPEAPQPEEVPEPQPEPEVEPPVESEQTPEDTSSVEPQFEETPIPRPFETLADLDQRVKAEEQAEAAEHAEAALDHALKAAQPANEMPTITPITPLNSGVTQLDEADEPSLGGTLNATTEQAADDARREEENDQNKTLLSHSYLQPSQEPPVAGIDTPNTEGTTEAAGSAYIIGNDTPPVVPPMPESQPFQPPQPPATPTDFGLPMPPPVPDFSQGVPPLTGPYAPPTQQPERLGDILADQPQPMAAPTLPPAAPPDAPPESLPPQPPIQPAGPYAPPAPDDPSQFKIPGQQ